MTKARFKILYVAVNLLLSATISESLKLSKSNDPNVVFELQTDITASIHIDENVPHAILFNMEDVKGDSKVPSGVGCARFRYEIVAEGDSFTFNLMNSLDYEQKDCKIINFRLEDQSDIMYLTLYVNNLDDNAPELTINGGSRCEFKENTPYTITETTCKLEMTDADGMMEKAIFTITPSTYYPRDFKHDEYLRRTLKSAARRLDAGTSGKNNSAVQRNVEENTDFFPVTHGQQGNEMEPSEGQNLGRLTSEPNSKIYSLVSKKIVKDRSVHELEDIFAISYSPIPLHDDKSVEVPIYLKDGKMLDYEDINKYIFTVEVAEELTKNSIVVPLDVIDMPDQPPKWVTVFPTQQFEENINQIFNVKAIDGDIGINNRICYKIKNNVCNGDEHTCKITIGEDDGLINVENVDREDVGDTISFVVEAIECGFDDTTPQNMYFFIEDQDDNSPRFEGSGTMIASIDENYLGEIGDLKFNVKDMDLADNGTYTIKMTSTSDSVDYTEPFQIIPTQGYQEGQFSITAINSAKLDFEDELWKTIEFELVATEKFDSSHIARRPVKINLRDLNDEYPIFVDTSDSTEIFESITKGKRIFDATATDKDAGDIVSYLIIGIWGQKLDIDTSGIISPKEDGVFDYEQLREVVMQIRASDSANHFTYKTLTINVLDVDDEPPSIKVVYIDKKIISIEENLNAHERITDAEITASDPDTKPKLKLKIDWSNSYVTKNSVQKTYTDDEWKCFDLITEDHEENAQKITGILEISQRCSPDFEKYDTISIGLNVTDENTEVGSSSSLGSIQIFITDVNDNDPIFNDKSFEGLKVTDGTNKDTADTIGTVTAYDPDMSDKVEYSIEPKDTKYDWIDINPEEGYLTIKKGVVINDDVPPRPSISFLVFASDGVHKASHTLDISMDDVNNQPPKILNKKLEITILEKTKSGDIIVLKGEDLDRDDAFHTMVFQFDINITKEASDCFDISDDGHISVNLKHGAELNRDTGQASYILPVLLYDNPKGTQQLKDHLDLKVNLQDINDNPPVIQNETLQCSENMKKGGTLGPIVAEDIDGEGANSKAKFEITNIVPISGTGEEVLSKNDLKISSTDFKTATLEFQRDLEGYFGTYSLTIHTSDYGEPIMTRDNYITLTVTKFNFKTPKFVFPPETGTFILSEEQIIGSAEPLKMYDQTDLQDLEVNDQQNHKWDVSFEFGDQTEEQSKLFSIKKIGTWKARLGLLRQPNWEGDKNALYTITIEASVKTERFPDEKTISSQIEMNFRFFSDKEEPEYGINECKLFFDEDAPDEHPADPPQPTEVAKYPSGVDLPVYYTLLDHTDVFEVNQTGFLSVHQELHYKVTPSFDIRIAASKRKSSLIDPPEKSVLNVHVTVNSLNINPPVFYPSKFNGAFLKTFNTQSTIVTVTATDEDFVDVGKLRYSLDQMTCKPSVQAPDEPFKIGDVDGKITPTFVLTSSMSGYCNMIVSVQDGKDKYEIQHKVDTTVQINIISTDELVQFIFVNDDSYISQHQEQITAKIEDIFKKYNYKCYLADLIYDTEWRNTTGDFYFLNAETEIPVEAKEILGILTDFDKFTALKKSLGDIGVNLENIPSANPTDVEDYMKIWLTATTIVLASFLVLLSVAFFFRNRALTQRISNLSTTKFGSQESNLNRAGLAAPTTNRNAVEGSNPVFHSEKFESEIETDTRSIISSDSDLFGIENNDQFDI